MNPKADAPFDPIERRVRVSTMINDSDIDSPIVLGGGIAGIAAAVELARHGLRPRLVEARGYLGGRVRSFLHSESGDEIDNGQHLMMGCYDATFALLDLLGTRGLVELQRTLSVEFRDADGTRDILQGPAFLPSPLDAMIGMMRLEGISFKERLALLRVAISARTSGAGSEETVREYLDRLGQSRCVQRRLWDPITIATLNTPPDRASATIFVEVLRQAFLAGGESSRLALPRAGLSALFEPARRYIEERGGTVTTGCTITAIESGDEGHRISVRGAEALVALSVISALPSRTLRALLAPSLRSRIAPRGEELEGSPIVSLYLWYDRELESIPSLVALLGTGIQWVFNRRRIVGTANARYPGLLACTISAAMEEAASSGDSIVEMANTELRAAFGEVRSASLMESLVIKEKEATFAATPAAEGIRPGTRTAVDGFYLAGDWTATGLPGTIEGAARSGVAAAREIVNP